MKFTSLRRTPEKTQKVTACGCFNLLAAILLATWSEFDDSLSTWCLSVVLFFNVLACTCAIVSQRLGTDSNNEYKTQWSDAKLDNELESMAPNNVAYSFGYARIEVLATFATCCVAQLGAFASAKEAAERFVYTSGSETRFTLLSACIFTIAHVVCWYFTLRNRAPFANALNESASSTLQEHATILCESLAPALPTVTSRYCLPRIDAFALLGGLMVTLQCIATIAVRAYESSVADNLVAVVMSIVIFCTMLPLVTNCATILLQTTPMHVAGQLDAALREASTLDGVLEFRNEHFWTVAFRRRLVGALHIRVRRDANEAAIVRCVREKLSPFIADLTVQVTKDRFAVPSVGGHQSHLQHSNTFAYAPASTPSPSVLPNQPSYPSANPNIAAAFPVHLSMPFNKASSVAANISGIAVGAQQGLPDLVQPSRAAADQPLPVFARSAERTVNFQ